MKKQYMDFVPAGSPRTVKKNVSREAVPRREPVIIAPKNEVIEARTQVETRTTTVVSGAVAFSTEKRGALGVVENLSPVFVKTDVPKRPLSEKPHFRTEKSDLAKVKAQRVGYNGKIATKPVVKPTAKFAITPIENITTMKNHTSVLNPKKTDKNTFKTPNSPFINQNKVEKRPLSKNVYPKKSEAPKVKEEPKGLETIIAKPEKQAHIGTIVTVILTIILGAAAGTVAFLLLPK